nr:energy transducer TonB [Flavobacterium sp.]
VIPLSEPEEEVTKERLINPEIVKSDENPDEVMTNVEAVEPTPKIGDGENSATSNAGQMGTTNTNSGNGAGTDTDNTAVITASLDRLPEFPGGIGKFLEYVGNNFREPDLSNARIDGSAIRVIVSFVIEKDGSMTDIKVLRNPGHGLDKEAIRVLKSQKTKWKPGVKNGKPVRTLYTLPISIVPR